MPGLLQQLITDARWQMRPGGLGAANGGDGLQYPYVIDATGIIYLTRDPDLAFWHAGDRKGNATSIPVHFPVGGLQDVTPAQWASGLALFQMLATHYHFPADAVRGHLEWPEADTICPGPRLMQRIRAHRRDVLNPGAGLYRVKQSVPAALIREGPGTTYPVALGGAARRWPGDRVAFDAVVQGAAVGKDTRWGHLDDATGFMSMTLVEAL